MHHAFAVLATASLSIGLAAAAAAADMRVVKAPVVAAPVAYDWSGFYLGGNIGYSVARNHDNEFLINPLTTSPQGQAFTLAPAGAVGGGQIGYNWQANGGLLFGLEADWQWTNQVDSACISFCIPGGGSLNVEQRLRWLATARGRIGYAANGWLWYATGGAAWGRTTNSDAMFFNAFRAGSFDHTKSGWTVGGGIETALAGGWTAKLEYLYVDLGRTRDVLTGFPTPAGSAFETIDQSMHDHIVRVGLNYRFGAAAAAAPARIPVYKMPVGAVAFVDWSGLYVGGNVGYGVGRNRGNEFTVDIGNQSFTLAPAGWVGGGQIGFNWQAAREWVLGVEADWQGSNQRDTVCLDRCVLPLLSLTSEQKLHWLATLRGRIGYARAGWLWYLTGGGAWGRVTEDDALVFIVPLGSGSFSHIKGGWTVGTGVETALAANWSAKLEYLYVDLGSTTDILLLNNPGEAPTETITKQVRDHIFRIGLNYRFDGNAPVVAKH